MNISLSENIHANRKRLGLTQERLAEVLGVTVGAVHKWETGMSVPELGLIIEMADYFDSSVDALLGYKIKDGRQEVFKERLRNYLSQKDFSGIDDVRMAVKKYPHSFEIIYKCAKFYMLFGLERSDKELLRTALELFEKSLSLLSQNSDPDITEMSITENISRCYLGLNETRKAVELLKKNNSLGYFDPEIGYQLSSSLNEYDEGEKYLIKALNRMLISFINVYFGLMNVYEARHDIHKARELSDMFIDFLAGFKKEGWTSFVDKMIVAAYITKAFTYLDENMEKARKCLRYAVKTAKHFDASPDYSMDSLKFFKDSESVVYDTIGEEAMSAIEKTALSFKDERFTKLYYEVINE
ncbi:MAG: helix-turn-helix transcriptional regulator [Lachnospiraceae bacterium]|nr:helix-turn-helix transcriptional regulator [Lachnospiraceae bacterium]